MRVQFASDLHLEFPENRFFYGNHPLQVSGDILLLAGDILQFAALASYDWFLDEVSEKYERVYWIPGNHEYYGYDLKLRSGSFCEAIRDNVFLVNDHAETIDGIRFIFSTMWTKITPAYRRDIERGMNDFRLIRYGQWAFDGEIYTRLYENSRAFIEGELQTNQKKVVTTHHVPTLQNYPPEYIGSVLNKGFAVELDLLIEKYQPDAWVYGHHHRNIPAFQIGRTKMLTNQLGYIAANEHFQFDPAANFTL